MGIPFYFKTIISRFPDIIKSPDGVQICERLYLDYNCIIHMCAGRLNGKINDSIAYQKQVIADSLAYIDVILQYVKPTELLFIAVDGTCPRAKMQQQRKRRFMSVWRSEKVKENTVWDSNIVTPGTEFMKEFDNALKNYTNTGSFALIKSDSSEPGEGEHKIYDHIQHTDFKGDCVIYGLDADLIMLSMIKDSHIRLLREVPEFNIPLRKQIFTPFLLLDIDTLKQTLIRELLMNDPSRIDDYIMLCALVGNDFIPPMTFLKIKTDGIETLIRLYNAIASDQKRLTVRGQGVNVDVLRELFAGLSSIEDQGMVDADRAYYSKRAFNTNIDSYPMLHKYPRFIDVSQNSWRLSYYKQLFQTDNIDAVKKTACETYFQGILWMYEYYFTKNHNEGWYYQFTYSPTCLDMYHFLVACENIKDHYSNTTNKHNSHNEFKMMMGKSYMQLLAVLPPSSKTLIPLKYQGIMDDIRLGCVSYYPHKFAITTYLKTYLWECSAILPDIDLQKVYKVYSSL